MEETELEKAIRERKTFTKNMLSSFKPSYLDLDELLEFAIWQKYCEIINNKSISYDKRKDKLMEQLEKNVDLWHPKSS